MTEVAQPVVYPPDLVGVLSSAVRPRDRLTVSEWADRNIVITTGAEKGPWRTTRVPYLREPMDAMSAHDATEEVVVIKAAQLGFSEAINCIVGYFMDHEPAPILMIQPDIKAAERYSKQRIARMIEASPALRAKVVEPKSRDSGNTIQDKEFEGGNFTILGANSPAGLASMPIRVVAFDAVDRYAPSAGDEGDAIDIAKQRTNTYARRKIIMGSTPNETSTSRIEPAYLESDQRVYFVPCPFCRHEQTLRFAQLRWPDGNPRAAVYECESCKQPIPEHHKRRMLERGRWVATYPAREVRGYKLNGLYSPWLKWHEIARRWLSAQGKPDRLKVFVNTILGESWDTHRETRVDPSKLSALSCPVALDEAGWPIVPRGVGVLTAAVDVQGDRLEVGLFGWGKGEEMWALDHRRIMVDPSSPQAWTELDEYLLGVWKHESGMGITIAAAAIDTGHHTQMAYAFVSSRAARKVWGIKGVGGQGRKLWPKKPSKSARTGATFYAVGVDAGKTQLYARIKASLEVVAKGENELAGAGAVHIAAHLAADVDYLKQLVAEVPETVRAKGHPRVVWTLPAHARNEALDCAVYAYAALQGWKARGRRIDTAVARLHPGGFASSANLTTPPKTPEPPKAESVKRPTPTPSPAPRAAPKKRPRYW